MDVVSFLIFVGICIGGCLLFIFLSLLILLWFGFLPIESLERVDGIRFSPIKGNSPIKGRNEKESERASK